MTGEIRTVHRALYWLSLDGYRLLREAGDGEDWLTRSDVGGKWGGFAPGLIPYMVEEGFIGIRGSILKRGYRVLAGDEDPDEDLMIAIVSAIGALDS